MDSKSSSSNAEVRLDGICVLVIEDEDDSLLLMETALKARGAIVRGAKSASEGRHLLEVFPADAIVSDISMPEEDGYSFIRSIRSLPAEKGGSTPAVALSGHAFPEDVRRSLEAGYDVHVTKPVHLENLLEAVRGLIDHAARDARIEGILAGPHAHVS
ncbi:response regulator [Pendulispora brunnea]|uniref:Response regulator n=1 Tax=Pendulispora brunnea TaxID=2905690 RepID=A0ABZ2K6J9_9BACT